MKKNTTLSYDVKVGETITIKVSPQNFGASMPSVEATLDGGPFAPKSTTAGIITYQFTVTKPVDDVHTVIMEFTFLPGSPKNAQYGVVISGKNDVGCPCGFTIKKTTANKEPAIEFFVVA